MGKKITSFTINDDILEDFDAYCKKNAINKSAMVEKMLQNYLKGKGNQ